MVTRKFSIANLRPNNWYIDSDKLEKIRAVWKAGDQHLLPPVLVSQIDGQLALIDGHNRVMVAFESGETLINGVFQDLEDIDGSKELYTYIHRTGPSLGINTIGDLSSRKVTSANFRKLWIAQCDMWLENLYSLSSNG